MRRDDEEFKAELTKKDTIQAGIVTNGTRLEQLAHVWAKAKAEQRPLRIGVTGGSFSAGAGLGAYLTHSYPYVLEDMGRRRADLFPFGVEVVNIAQGGTG
eukprot:CAMPEP_0113869304 /NCGR_PEP_ID=MMETSP0780_2-20120614/1462_1 /TAXON_ID=652834 /ORGANISM="Palpitomonas bilix" /LENGTH=99 /DNA_ID=CAMNT_0000854467 /DNA_START=259 /DNA_END=554 /DNA_ORIENTATION=+ /assembly_acc=CAM_ASM_000599